MFGEETGESEFPWEVMVEGARGQGGGSLISRRHVLTAAHILHTNRKLNRLNMQEVKVFLGSHNQKKLRYVLVKRVIEHPEYKELDKFPLFDFALIELAKPVTISDTIKPICLPADSSVTFAGLPALATGWGRTEEAAHAYGVDKLMKAALTIVDAASCAASYAEKNMTISECMLCADAPVADACKGDSGGPLVVEEPSNRWTLVS